MALNVEEIREDFPILSRKINGKRLVYLDNAATTQKPKQVIEAIKEYYEKHNANVHRSIHTLGKEATLLYEEAREKIAKFINAKKDEIIFTRNTTEAINIVAQRIKIKGKIISTFIEHHSNFVPWQVRSQEEGIEFKLLNVNEEGFLIYDEKDFENCGICAVNHASNVTGIINNIEEIGKMVHENGGLLVCDAAQTAPHLKIDVKKMDVDFLAFSGHKMLGPMGIGVLYGKREFLEKLEPLLYGGEMIESVDFEKSIWKEPPYRFEAGTPNVCGAIGLKKAVEYLEKIGMEKIEEHERKLTKYALKRMKEMNVIEIIGPKEPHKKLGLISFLMKGVHPHDIAQLLDREGIAVRAGHHCAQLLHKKLCSEESSARASFYIYNNEEDIDKLIEGLEKIRKMFGV